jgi:hypothetical protein
MDMRADDDDITVSTLGNRKNRPPCAQASTLYARPGTSASGAGMSAARLVFVLLYIRTPVLPATSKGTAT